jgi:drug/metabolite transporter (DMT)-like permease
VAALGYGVSDFVGGVASRRVAALRVVLLSYPIALTLLLAAAAVYGGDLSRTAVGWGLLAGVSQAFGVWWFYAALGAGPISVVSPLTSVLVAAIPAVAGVVLGERPGAVAVLGVVLGLASVVLVSRRSGTAAATGAFTVRVAWLTVGSGVAFGMNFVVLHQVPATAGLWPLVFARLAATGIVVLAAALTGNLRIEGGATARLAVLAGVLDTVANIATLLALQSSLLSLTGVLIALYPAATVLLAIAVLRERVTRAQGAGMLMALAAVALLAAA